ncbi:MAG: amino acid adenylation domain-containing protein [Pseudomonadota bacterium]
MTNSPDVEDIYELTPAQAGMLFHTLASPGTGTYVQQLWWTLEGELDATELAQAWERVAARYGVLRTSFHWEGLERPYQMVHRRVRTPVVDEDLSGLAAAEQAARLGEILTADRRAGFDLTRAPAVRLHRYRLGAQRQRIMVTYHHILLDGWSVPVVSRELLLEVAAAREGKPLSLPPSVPFSTHVRRVMAADQTAATEHWRQRLGDFTAPSYAGVMARASRDGDKATAVAKQAVTLDAEAAERVEAAARQAGVTLGTMALGAWAIALSGLSGRSDVLFGVTSSGRDAAAATAIAGAKATPTVGMCLTTLPLRADLGASPTLREWLRDLQRRQAEDRRYEHTPLTQLRGLAELPGDTSLFDSIVVVGNTPLATLEQAAGRFSGLRITELGDYEKTNYPFTLMVSPRTGIAVQGLGGTGTDPQAVACAVQLFARVLQTLPDCLDKSPLRVPLADGVDATAPSAATEALRDARDPLPRVLHYGATQPDAVALTCDDVSVSYAELSSRVRARARQLHAAGVEAGDRVAVAAEPGIDLVEALLAVLHIGATCVPLDPEQPAGRRRRMLQTAAPAAVLASSTFREALASVVLPASTGASVPILLLDDPAPDNNDSIELQRSMQDNTLSRAAYVLFTSGSTGAPKGVALPLHTLARLVEWQNARSGAEACAVTLALAPVGFDVAFQELLSTLAAGGRLVIANRAQRRDPNEILKLIDAEGVTRLFAPCIMLDAIAQAAPGRAQASRSLREVVTAGEALRVSPAMRRWLAQAPGVVLDNQYGPTEAHVVCAHRLEGDPDGWEELPPIGHALPGMRLEVLDRAGRRLPAGIVGELHIAGAGLAHGYLADPQRSAKAFLPDAHASDGGRSYRTGDLVRRRGDGSIAFVGRRDTQVKLRGFRVEFGEIESTIARHETVRSAAVRVQTGADGRAVRLIAYVVLTPGGSLEALQVWLADELPGYMRPDLFVPLTEMPRSANGKLDRRALPEPTQDLASGGRDAVEPRTEMERLIADEMGRVLGRDTVGAHEDFFELGGHSLAAIRVATQLRSVLGRDIPVVKLFEQATPAKLAAWVEAVGVEDSALAIAPVRGELPQERPLSSAQVRLFTLNPQVPPTHRFYHTVTARRLRGPLEVKALEAALDVVQARHEPLRTAFDVQQLSPLRVRKRVLRPTTVALSFVDLSDRSTLAREYAVRERAEEDFAEPFDLALGQLLRATLLRLEPEHHVLIVVCHQLAFDAWSREVMLRDIEQHYLAATAGTGASVASEDEVDNRLRYDDLVAFEGELLASEQAVERLATARARLLGPNEPLAFDTDHPRPAVKTFEGIVLPVRIPLGLTAKVRELARTAGVTLYMALLSLYAVWLHAYSGQHRLRIGSSSAGRRHPAAEQLVGPFNDFLVLPIDLEGNPSFRELMLRVRRVALEAHADGEVPFTRLVDALGLPEDLSRTPVFQAMFTYKRFLDRPEGRLGDLTVEGLHVDWLTARTDLTLSLLDDGEEIVGFLEASAELFDRDRMLLRLQHAQVLLEAAARDPDAPLATLPLTAADALRYDSLSSLSPEEQRYLDALTQRHQSRTKGSRSLIATYHDRWADERFVAGYRDSLRAVAYPVFADRAEGARLYDVDGNAYIDLTMSFGATLFGHAPGFLRDALTKEIEKGFALSSPSPRAGEAAARLQQFIPAERVALLGTRTEAVIVAVRACRAATGRSKVVVFRGAYHGNADEMQYAPNPFDPGARPPGIPEALAGDVLVLDYLEASALEAIALNGGDIAAVLVEPVQSQLAVRLGDDPATFLTHLRELTSRLDVPLVVDETVFGLRAHPSGCQGVFGIDADLAVYGKPLANGLPVGAVAGRGEFMDRIDGGPWMGSSGGELAGDRIAAGSTFGGHPLTMAAACAVLGELERLGPGFQRQLNARTADLCERINGWLQAEGAPLQMTHFASRFGFVPLGGSDLGPLLRLHLLERGVYLRGDCGSLSSAHTDDDLAIIEGAVQDTVRTLAAAGFRL